MCGAAVENDSVVITPVLVWDCDVWGDEKKEASEQGGDGKPAAKRAKGDASEALEMVTNQPIASYVCQLPDIPGKFLPQKAASLGVPRGPLYGKLQKGESVEATNGQMVHPKDVMEPSTPGPTVMVVDCPSVGHVEGLREGLRGWSEEEEKRL